MSMADLYNQAKDAGFTGGDLGPGEYDVLVGWYEVKTSDNGNQVVNLRWDAVDRSGSVFGRQVFAPSRFFQQNPTATVEQLAAGIKQQSDQGRRWRIKVTPQKGNAEFTDVKVLGDATGAGNVVAGGGPAQQAAAVVPPPPAQPAPVTQAVPQPATMQPAPQPAAEAAPQPAMPQPEAAPTQAAAPADGDTPPWLANQPVQG
jgi:hypothetical protein